MRKMLKKTSTFLIVAVMMLLLKILFLTITKHMKPVLEFTLKVMTVKLTITVFHIMRLSLVQEYLIPEKMQISLQIIYLIIMDL